MNILLVTNMYPYPENPYYGIFVKEQEAAIVKEFKDVHFTLFFINGKLGQLEYLKSMFRIHKLLKKEKFDLVHVHYGFSGLFLLLKRLRNIPVLVTLHGGDIQAEQGKKIQVFLTKKILKRANAAITLNDRMDDVVKRFITRTYLVPCSVDTDLFTPLNGSSSIRSTKKIIFPSDSARYVKNYPLFEETISILRNQYNIECETYQVKNMSREQVAALYQTSDLMLMTSISEGSPQVVKEAMACNLPVVSTNVGDVSILLDNVESSAVSSKMDAKELALLCKKSLDGEFKGIKGRDKIYQLGLDNRNIAHKVYDIYNSLLSRF